jgi:hypothetical protein
MEKQIKTEEVQSAQVLINYILQVVKELKEENEELRKTAENKKVYSSDQLNELFAALAKAQAEMPIANENSTNPYFKSRYADLAQIVKCARPCLAKNNLCVLQPPCVEENGRVILPTILGHSSGQFIRSELPVTPTKQDIQSFGSYLTYLRRYSYTSLIGMVSSDDDDDGEQAMVETREIRAKKPSITNYKPKEQAYEFITKEQREELEHELDGYDDICEEVMEKLQLGSLADMPKSKFLGSIKRIRELKQIRDGK